MTIHYYRVAGFLFSVCLPMDMDQELLLPSFLPFRTTKPTGDEERLFDFTAVSPNVMPDAKDKELLEKTDNDMGHLNLYATSEGYLIEIINGCYTHLMMADTGFTSIKACLHREDRNARHALSSLLRISYAQAILCHAAVSIHAAHIPGTGLLNDDNPTVRLVNGKAYAYGTPWSGKTACYKNLSFPIGGMVRLYQASANKFCRQDGTDAFVALYPGCSVIAEDERLRNSLYDTLARLADTTVIGTMECLPDEMAAWTCYHAVTNNKQTF